MIEKQTASKLKNYSTHLKSLPQQDRYTRFGAYIKDESIDTFILSILYNLDKHHIFAYTEGNEVLGYVHLAQINDHSWELAISVESSAQGKGVGDKLIGYAIRWAKTHGIESMFMHCITDNKRIQHLANKHGLKTVERDGTDITAKVELPSPTIVDNINSLVHEQTQILRKIISLQGQLVSNLTMTNK